jgi:DNA topoisomerase-1
LEKQTEPPARYTEAGLVKELERRGIGRPSTYASIIKTIQDREYVVKEGRSLKPTDTGDVVSTFLEQNFGEYINDTFTAEMEDELDLIAEGKIKYEKVLGDFYKPFLKDVKSKDKMDKLTTLGDADPKLKCPICGSAMIVKLGRGGKFLSCSKYPDCKGMLLLDGTEMPKDRVIGIYPENGMEITMKTGKFGPYIQVGEKTKEVKFPKRASVPPEKVATLTLDEALHLLSLPRLLGKNPETGKEISANKGRFGPYIVEDGDFRSLKTPDDVYTITLARALEILKEPKKKRGFARKKKE